MTIAQYVRERRIKAQVTQGQVAHRLGVQQQLVSAWEKGKQGIPYYRVEALAKILKVPASELFTVWIADRQSKVGQP